MNITKVKVETPQEFPFVVTRGHCKVRIYRVKSAKNKGGFAYQVADYSQGKGRKLISFADFSEAKREAERIADCVAAGEVHALEMRGPERASYGRAIELLGATGTPLELAAARYAEAATLLGDGSKVVEAAKFFLRRYPANMPDKIVAEVVAEMIALKTSRGASKRYLEDLESRFKRFAGDFQVKIADVDSRRIQTWLDGLRSVNKGQKLLGRQSYAHYRTVVGSLFSFAEARGYIPKGTNPVEDIERVKVRGKDTQVFTPSEFAALLNAASHEYIPALAIGGFSGLRSAEIQRLEWSDIRFDGDKPIIEVSASKAKTASRRTVPICPALAAWLHPFAGSTGFVWEGNGHGFVNIQRRTAKLAGLRWKSNALRHSYASYRLSETGDAARTAYEMGNTAAIVHRHYNALVRAEDAKAWFSIMPAHGANITQMPATQAAAL
jgi:integrase